MSRPDFYEHLNKAGDGVVSTIEESAAQIDELNYGTHRFLSAIIRLRRAKHQTDDLADALEEVLHRGLY